MSSHKSKTSSADVSWTVEDSALFTGELEKLKKKVKYLKRNLKSKELANFDCREDMINNSIQILTDLAKHFEADNEGEDDKRKIISDSYRKLIVDKSGNFDE